MRVKYFGVAVPVIIIAIITPLFANVQAKKSKTVLPGVMVKARAHKDRILLRWAVNEPAAWKLANKYGYIIERYTILRSDKINTTKEIIEPNRTDLNCIGTTRNPFMKVFTVAPDSNGGAFIVRVTLEDNAAIQLKLINVLTNQVSNLVYQPGPDGYVLPVNVPVISGTYMLLLETPKKVQQ